MEVLGCSTDLEVKLPELADGLYVEYEGKQGC